jgi:hypothetical protein
MPAIRSFLHQWLVPGVAGLELHLQLEVIVSVYGNAFNMLLFVSWFTAHSSLVYVGSSHRLSSYLCPQSIGLGCHSMPNRYPNETARGEIENDVRKRTAWNREVMNQKSDQSRSG